MIQEVKHSRFDKDHYQTCDQCSEDHLDFIEQLRQDEEVETNDED